MYACSDIIIHHGVGSSLTRRAATDAHCFSLSPRNELLDRPLVVPVRETVLLFLRTSNCNFRARDSSYLKRTTRQSLSSSSSSSSSSFSSYLVSSTSCSSVSFYFPNRRSLLEMNRAPMQRETRVSNCNCDPSSPPSVSSGVQRAFFRLLPTIQTAFALQKVPSALPSFVDSTWRVEGSFSRERSPFRREVGAVRFTTGNWGERNTASCRVRGTRRFTVARILNGHLRRPSKLKRTNLTVHTASCRRRAREKKTWRYAATFSFTG